MDKMKKENLMQYITRFLIALGFSPRHLGFRYIREIILIGVDTNDKQLTRAYLYVAHKYGVPVEAVQTAIRTALKAAQEQECFFKIENIIGAKFIDPKYLLSPREFFSIMQEYLNYVWDGRNELF